jgi:hypothetical protein
LVRVRNRAKGNEAEMAQEILITRRYVNPLLAAVLLLVTQTTSAEPTLLGDKLMDRVVAGAIEVGNGVVVAHGSDAKISEANRLQLNHDAQLSTRAINLTNSTGSAVVNVVNIWDGSGVISAGDDNGANTEVGINQSNNVIQEQPGAATLTGYLRSETEYEEIVEHSGSSSRSIRTVDHHDVTKISNTENYTMTESQGWVDTAVELKLSNQITFNGHLGQGIAFAGDAYFNIEPGSADIGIAAENDGTGNVTAGADGSLSATGDLVLITRVDLPEITLDINGSGCAVAMGSCAANSTVVVGTSSYTDNSTLDIIENFESAEIAFSDFQSYSYRSPLQFERAEAEYIVIDNSKLALDSGVELELTDSAQKGARGMNIVNAIGSNVANATNIARTQSFGGSRSKLVLNQFNTVRHGH